MSIQLTKRIGATLQSKDRPYEVRDAQVRGLLFRVQPSGHKAWIVTWAHGKRRTLGSSQNLTLDQARAVAGKVIAEFVQTGLPNIAKPNLPKITLLRLNVTGYQRSHALCRVFSSRFRNAWGTNVLGVQ